MDKYFIGIDVGTQGTRIVLVNQLGELLAASSRDFDLAKEFRQEQSPLDWWTNCIEMLSDLLQHQTGDQIKKNLVAISVTSTSGTVIPLDSQNKPIYPAIMYSDPRSKKQGEKCQQVAKQYVKNGYTGFNASSGISKICWFMETFPGKCADIALWIHASDYIVGQLCGDYHTTDFTNALKSGFDLTTLQWPEYITNQLGIQADWLQNVVPSGTVVGQLTDELVGKLGVPPLAVVVGMTDGCASQIASGAVNPGDWNTTIGTTLVIKGVTQNQVIDPEGRVYSHRHPEGYWMPGGASNTGADWIALDFSVGLDELNKQAERYMPTGSLAWPLKQLGERFPIVSPQARGFAVNSVDRNLQYTANLEGVAFIERLAYEIIEELSGEKVKAVYAAGGGSNSDAWLKIRASVLKVKIYKCTQASGAFGAAVMAACKTHYTSVSIAAQNMCSIEKEVLPTDSLVPQYEAQYQKFKQKLKDLNYL